MHLTLELIIIEVALFIIIVLSVYRIVPFFAKNYSMNNFYTSILFMHQNKIFSVIILFLLSNLAYCVYGYINNHNIIDIHKSYIIGKNKYAETPKKDKQSIEEKNTNNSSNESIKNNNIIKSLEEDKPKDIIKRENKEDVPKAENERNSNNLLTNNTKDDAIVIRKSSNTETPSDIQTSTIQGVACDYSTNN